MSRPIPIVFLSLLLAGFACGQSAYNPNILPLGHKEALMANTGTGGIGSTGAVYYNPGALASLEEDYFSLSGAAYLRYTFEADPIAVINGRELTFEGDAFRSIPTSVIRVNRLGDWRLAFSALIPMQFNYEGIQEWEVPVFDDVLAITSVQNYQPGQ